MKKRGMAVLTAGCMLVGMLAGCSHTTETQTASSAAASSETAAASTTEAATGAATEATTSASSSTYGPDQYSYMLEDNGYIQDVVALDYVELPDFSSITFSKSKDFAPSEDEIDSYISYFLVLKNLYNEDTESAIEDGDSVVIDYVGKVDGEAFDNGTATNQSVTAGGSGYIDDFLDQIIGHKPGETFDVEVTFPEEYSNDPDLAGKDAVFTVTVQYIKRYMEFDDALVASHQTEIQSYFGTEEPLLTAESVRNYIRDYVAEQNESDVVDEYFYKNITLKDGMEIPDNATAYAYMSINMYFLSSYGYSLSEMIDAGYYTDEGVTAMVYSEAKYALFCQALAEREGWSFTEADLTELTGAEDNSYYLELYGFGYMFRSLLTYRVEQYIEANVVITD